MGNNVVVCCNRHRRFKACHICCCNDEQFLWTKKETKLRKSCWLFWTRNSNELKYYESFLRKCSLHSLFACNQLISSTSHLLDSSKSANVNQALCSLPSLFFLSLIIQTPRRRTKTTAVKAFCLLMTLETKRKLFK